jgi:hypothetical protein
MRLKVDIEKLNVDNGYVDVARWFKRYELFFECQNDGKSEEDLGILYLKYLPLYLTGSALLCFEELPEEDQQVYGTVKRRLEAFHSLDSSTAYALFVESRYTGGGVDIFIAELRRFLAVIQLGKADSDKLVLEQFLKGC